MLANQRQSVVTQYSCKPISNFKVAKLTAHILWDTVRKVFHNEHMCFVEPM